MKHRYQLSFQKRDTAIVLAVRIRNKNEEKQLHTKSPDKLMRRGKLPPALLICLFCMDTSCRLTLCKDKGAVLQRTPFTSATRCPAGLPHPGQISKSRGALGPAVVPSVQRR